ncbi:MAG TPA: CDP-diacylglycerol--glycerol-3-phosphate 3-phosphatidyltransferase [Pyrinomonadaceae bacterium]
MTPFEGETYTSIWKQTTLEKNFSGGPQARGGGGEDDVSVNLPNALTLLRIFIVPLLVAVLLTPFGENWFGVPRHILGVTIFLAAALTDFLDGHIARSRNQVSRFGELLDPIADKLLISAALISLVENRLAPAWAVVIIIGREFAVSGLRSIAAGDGVVIAASRMGKFKMAAQVVAVALLIVSSAKGAPPVGNFGRAFPAIQFWTVPELRVALSHLFGAGATTATDWQVLLYTMGRAMLWVVVFSAFLSMYEYFRAFYKNEKRRGARAREAAHASTTPAGNPSRAT